jgi:hypothetical protein
MHWVVVVLALVGPTDDAAQAQREATRKALCSGVTVSVSAETPRVKVGERPRFSARIHNDTHRPVRVIDVRQGRRPDLQASYFELFVTRRSSVVDTPIMISDPGPLGNDDFFDLSAGSVAEIRDLSYTRSLSELRSGTYDAFVLFWRDPLSPHATRCRSTAARFVVEK